MIAYDLQCANGHHFEGWFEDRRAYETQERQGLISCPVCDDSSVFRIPSTFAIKSSPAVKDHPEKPVDLEDFSEKVVDFVEKNFDDVGSDFAKEALKIHYGVTEARNIRGVSTKEEEKTLKKEGIQFFKIPVPVTSETDS
jgi:hypothetical protein